jgi:integrase
MCLGGIRRDRSGSYVVLTPDGCLYGLVDAVAQCLGQLVDGVTHGRAVHITVTGTRLHTLRHSAAVAWLESGVHIKAVADLLGHSSIAITGDVYGHTSDDVARAAIAGLSGALSL